MKKIFTLFVASLFLGGASISAQSLFFVRDGQRMADNAEITITEVEDDGFGGLAMESGVHCENTSIFPVNATMSQTVVTAPQAGELSFCFGNCVIGNNDISLNFSVPVGVSSGNPHLSFLPEKGSYTQVKVIYKLYPESNTEESVTLTINYDYKDTQGINDDAISQRNVNVITAGGNTEFVYDFDKSANRRLAVYDVTGRVVYKTSLRNLSGSQSVGLSKGVYFYTIEEGRNLVETNKFIAR
ncbi:hypothetical protein M2132_001590 [Dysgonomonas sp. PH5-45]|uniref:T9SS type A sorting domain-containing protein n=1 Tax=unclassified Dysgonomonas TaxID=2630389 RepID=UPI002473D068|nr:MULTISPECIES: T9SS type A sorting domain-containing protein [unclassified Dysgonomonas]MDH6355252.1 hypothetical protein [Dysgonomonas sp. PH5-45]MDH6388126.1 hypothetical protein [Dysgonomonas sp. PH5-37]